MFLTYVCWGIFEFIIVYHGDVAESKNCAHLKGDDEFIDPEGNKKQNTYMFCCCEESWAASICEARALGTVTNYVLDNIIEHSDLYSIRCSNEIKSRLL